MTSVQARYAPLKSKTRKSERITRKRQTLADAAVLALRDAVEAVVAAQTAYEQGGTDEHHIEFCWASDFALCQLKNAQGVLDGFLSRRS